MRRHELIANNAEAEARRILRSGRLFHRHWIPESLDELSQIVAVALLEAHGKALNWALAQKVELPAGLILLQPLPVKERLDQVRKALELMKSRIQ